jgi:hypothetical protein
MILIYRPTKYSYFLCEFISKPARQIHIDRQEEI